MMLSTLPLSCDGGVAKCLVDSFIPFNYAAAGSGVIPPNQPSNFLMMPYYPPTNLSISNTVTMPFHSPSLPNNVHPTNNHPAALLRRNSPIIPLSWTGSSVCVPVPLHPKFASSTPTPHPVSAAGVLLPHPLLPATLSASPLTNVTAGLPTYDCASTTAVQEDIAPFTLDSLHTEEPQVASSLGQTTQPFPLGKMSDPYGSVPFIHPLPYATHVPLCRQEIPAYPVPTTTSSPPIYNATLTLSPSMNVCSTKPATTPIEAEVLGPGPVYQQPIHYDLSFRNSFDELQNQNATLSDMTGGMSTDTTSMSMSSWQANMGGQLFSTCGQLRHSSPPQCPPSSVLFSTQPNQSSDPTTEPKAAADILPSSLSSREDSNHVASSNAERLSSRDVVSDGRGCVYSFLHQNCTVGDIVKKASVCCERGRLQEAIRIYNEGLQIYPNNLEILNCKVNCCRQLGLLEEAMDTCHRAEAVNATDLTTLNNKGGVHLDRSEVALAIECFSSALKINPSHTQTLSNLSRAVLEYGVQLKLAGKTAQAVVQLENAIRLNPMNENAIFYLGIIQAEAGHLHAALDKFNEAIRLNSTFIEALTCAGNIWKTLGQLETALEFYLRAHSINSNYEPVRLNLSTTLTDLGTATKLKGDVQMAKKYYKKALVYNPRYAHAYYNLGVAYGEIGKADSAVICYHLAVTFNPQFSEAYNNLGVIYKDKENLESALHYYTKALEVNPTFAQTLNNIGVIYTIIGKMTEAYAFTRRAIEVNPNYAEAYNNLGVMYRDQGDVDLALQAYERCIEIDPNSRNALQNRLLAMNYLSNLPKTKIFESAKQWGISNTLCRPVRTDWKVTPWSPTSKHRRRPLRIGYIGPDFFTHSVSYFIHAPLMCHDSTRCQVFVYANVVKEDEKTQLFKSYVAPSQWRSIVGLSEEEVENLIVNDQIDILVELTGHTANNRLDVMARRPAPVQITWIGYPNTTGLPSVDYRLTDSNTDPIELQENEDSGVSTKVEDFYVEELIRLPTCFLCYHPPPDAPLVSPAAVKKAGFVTFGSFNNLAKIQIEVVDLWCRILREVPNSRLLLKAKPFGNIEIQQRYISLFSQRGVTADRLDFMSLIPSCSDHLKVYSLMDIALDTFPYAGTTTTCESLWMGIPVVSLKGKFNHAQNVGVSLLRTVGLPELIANSPEEYVSIAITLAKDVDRISHYHNTIRARMARSPLCDGLTFTAHLEDIYERLYTRWLRGDSPASARLSQLPFLSASSDFIKNAKTAERTTHPGALD